MTTARLTLKNTPARWGLISMILHWGVALAVFGLFGLGLWMTGLSYYDPWYKTGPDLHRAIGVLVFIAVALRLVWRWWDGAPKNISGHSRWERKAAHTAHGLLYALLFTVMITGYLISTADGRPVSVFGLFDVPATLQGLKGQEDIAGIVHLVLAIGLVAVAAVHAAGALKHHVIDKDETLKRMTGF